MNTHKPVGSLLAFLDAVDITKCAEREGSGKTLLVQKEEKSNMQIIDSNYKQNFAKLIL